MGETAVEPEEFVLDLADDAGAEERLTAALATAQAEFPKIARTNTAEVRGKDGKPGYSYTYADLGDVLGAVRPVLARNGLALTQRTRHLESGKVLLSTELRHIAGAVLDSEVELGQAPNNPQAFGGALTYLRRYEAVTLLGIAAEEDRDAQDVPVGGRAPAPELPAWAEEASDERKADLLKALAPIVGHQRAVALCKATSETFGSFPDMIVGFCKGLATHHASAQREPAPTTEDAEPPAAPPEAPSEGESEPPPEAQGDGSAAEGDAESSAIDPGSVEPEHEDAEKLCICPNGLASTGDELKNECPILGHGVPF